jgi:hypothetical protein
MRASLHWPDLLSFGMPPACFEGAVSHARTSKRGRYEPIMSNHSVESSGKWAGRRTIIPVSVAVGLVWNVIAICLMGGRVSEAFSAGWLLAGALAGVVAGRFTIWSRRRRDGRESVFYGIANYYLGIFVYWASFVVIQRVIMCIQHGGWTDFDLHDHLSLIVVFLVYGTLWFGILLIPLCFLSRYVLWQIYNRKSVAE